MSTISGISGSGNWSMMQGMRQPPDGKKMAEELFSKLDSSGQGYIDKTTLQSALGKTSSSASVDELFATLDSDSDGKVTEDEFISMLDSLASQFKAPGMGGNMPPPPPAGDAGFTKEELTSQLDKIGSSNSERSSLISSIIENFEAADTDQDGKVSFQEAMAYKQSTSGSSSTTDSDAASSSVSTDSSARIMQQIMQLMQAYVLDDSSGNGSTLSVLA